MENVAQGVFEWGASGPVVVYLDGFPECADHGGVECLGDEEAAEDILAQEKLGDVVDNLGHIEGVWRHLEV